MTKRTYRKPCAEELARIEKRRADLCVSHEDLYRAAGLKRSAYYDMRKTACAFPRVIEALRFGLRTLEQKQRAAARILDGVEA